MLPDFDSKFGREQFSSKDWKKEQLGNRHKPGVSTSIHARPAKREYFAWKARYQSKNPLNFLNHKGR